MNRRTKRPAKRRTLVVQQTTLQARLVLKARELRSTRSLPDPDMRAISALLNRMAAESRLADLRAIANYSEAECVAWADGEAASDPDNPLWDDWRLFRWGMVPRGH
jgi:hypothetical protein